MGVYLWVLLDGASRMEERLMLNRTDKIFDTPKLKLITPLTSMFLKVALPSNDENLIIVRPPLIVAARFWVHLQ